MYDFSPEGNRLKAEVYLPALHNGATGAGPFPCKLRQLTMTPSPTLLETRARPGRVAA